ncbi:acetyl-CoA carboxylase, biotin carboxyl carrier protein [Candidatus Endolissoclinum faulkneri L2]|uniref:Biotin carboxyl carrier protein of acetyl-CoA carboxylase n=1 Tax=Candidatus Endolissoclinum faulkneri L2 TaxID=1193729 RepID=K7YPA2_9PROT|nr:acetyl-CoA carboxylase biotin carboxyl carrier protein subunit [Candidatus Endolissoclinum faulkneri]AFX99357.1 acetyl-CoA carboxylase, biotin carboxyl carrier protein [Candidatus Endolissoclinum faulkneri L2]
MKNNLEENLIRKLVELLKENELGELEYATSDLRIRISNPKINAAYTTQVSASTTTAAISDSDTSGNTVEDGDVIPSPMVGTAYLAPEENAAAFAPIGSSVRSGQTIMIVEAMKTMNPIPAPRAGKVKAVHVQNGQPVEFGQPLLVLE